MFAIRHTVINTTNVVECLYDVKCHVTFAVLTFFRFCIDDFVVINEQEAAFRTNRSDSTKNMVICPEIS